MLIKKYLIPLVLIAKQHFFFADKKFALNKLFLCITCFLFH